MKLVVFFGIAVQSMLSNKLRSSLTMLGMIIGVGAVIVLMSVGAGLQNMIDSTFSQLGTNLLFVQPSNPNAPGIASMAPSLATNTLTMADVQALQRIPALKTVVPVNENFIKIVAGNKNVLAAIDGSTPQYKEAYGFDMAEGQFISDVNVARRDMVIVLGNKVATDLFGNTSAIGQNVRIQGKRFTVIGVMAPRGMSSFGFSWDSLTVTPITTFQVRLFPMKTPDGQDTVQQMSIQVASGWSMQQATDDIKTVLRKQHHITNPANDDFSVMSPEQLMGTFKTITLGLTVFLGLIGSISLLVGSIGIMNIMLVSVTERTREIGLRKAIGAKRRDILLQFLLEAAILSLSGGAIGLIGAWLVSAGISRIDLGGFTITAVISPVIVVVAVVVSVLIGLASGIYPAMRAARLNPIDALHYG